MSALSRHSLLLATALLLPVERLTAQAAKTPATGADVLAAMRAAYDGRWYHTLTFIQKTTFHRPNGVQEQLWYETLRHTPATGVQLRIDVGDLSAGNGVIFTADSTIRVRGGQAQPAVATGCT